MVRPSWQERICKVKDEQGIICYGDLERLYIRRSGKMIPIGRRCDRCGYVQWDEKPKKETVTSKDN